jgi:Ribbon-helix-helix protein, copG family
MPYTVGMRKTSVYLDDVLARRLARLADEEGRSQAEIIRAAIAAYKPRGSSDRIFALDGCATGTGISIATIDEDELLRGFGV